VSHRSQRAVPSRDAQRLESVRAGMASPYTMWLPQHRRTASGGPERDLPEPLAVRFICEAAHPEDAALLAAASQSRPNYDIAELGGSAGPLCAIMVARPRMPDVPPIETSDSLRRFYEPIQSILTHSS
jgi:hypothetical protein